MAYSCSQCGLKYSRMWSLNRHLKKCFKFYQPIDTALDEQNDDSLSEKGSTIPHNQRDIKRQRVESTSEDEESKSKHGDDGDENSGIENHDEPDENVNNESVAETNTSEDETSESEDDEEEDITMDEEHRQETSIEWPVSRTYKIKFPWSFWGELPNIKKHIRWLERLQDSEPPTVIYNIQNASNSQLTTLFEIAYNCVNGHIPLEHWNRKELRKHRRAVRLLANSDVDIEDKRSEILRRGANFVEMLLYAINPLILFNVPRALKIVIPHEGVSEEEDFHDY